MFVSVNFREQYINLVAISFILSWFQSVFLHLALFLEVSYTVVCG
jgi:hypothetical protein